MQDEFIKRINELEAHLAETKEQLGERDFLEELIQ
jgi:hypothetical protein